MKQKDIEKRLELIDVEIFEINLNKQFHMFTRGLYASAIVSLVIAYFILKYANQIVLVGLVIIAILFGIGLVRDIFSYLNSIKMLDGLLKEKKNLIKLKQ